MRQPGGNLLPILVEQRQEQHGFAALQPFGEKRPRAVEIRRLLVELTVAVEERGQRLQMLVRRLYDTHRAA